MLRRGWFCGLCFAMLLPACGGRDTDESDPDFLYPTQESFCQALAKLECTDSVVKACYGSDQDTLVEDRKACETARGERCNPQNLPYHPEAAQPCLAAREGILQDAVWTKDEIASVDKACLPVFSLAGKDGSFCYSDESCDTGAGLHCIVKLVNAGGVCGIPVVAAGGESCSDPKTICDDEFFCDPQGTHCLKRPVLNEACSVAAPCAGGFYCTDPETGTCLEKSKNGQDCSEDALCAGGFCVGATETMSGTCSATLPLTIGAASCDPYTP